MLAAVAKSTCASENVQNFMSKNQSVSKFVSQSISQVVNSENQSSRDTGGPGIEAGFPLVFHSLSPLRS